MEILTGLVGVLIHWVAELPSWLDIHKEATAFIGVVFLFAYAIKHLEAQVIHLRQRVMYLEEQFLASTERNESSQRR